MLGQELQISDLKDIHPDLANTMNHIETFCTKKYNIEHDPELSDEQKKKAISELKCMGGKLETMDLSFCFAEGALKENGENIVLTTENVDEYLELTKSLFLGAGIQLQINAFRKGFCEFFPIEKLAIFSPFEIDRVLCGACQHTVSWDKAAITEGLSIQSGYTLAGKAIQNLLQTMMEFTMEERRRFLSWVTGSPRLPVGGFRNLQTKISVFRKLPPEGTIDPDNDLPSVVACFSKLNMPDYSTQTIMVERIRFSMGTGTGKYTLT